MMKTKSSDVADFYQQLALLVRAKLPLPKSLLELSRMFPTPEFEEVIQRLSQRTGRGETFSEVIRSYPRLFPPVHVGLIVAGEAAGALAETLFAVARLARFQQLLGTRVRDILIYPLLTINVAAVIVMLTSRYVLPSFDEIFMDLLGGGPLPYITQLVMNTSRFVSHWWSVILPCYFALLGFTVWLFTPGLRPHRVLLAIISHMPGSCRIVHSLDSARLCSLLAVFLRQKMPMTDALTSAADLVEQKPLQTALLRAANRIESGADVTSALSGEQAVDNLLALTFAHTPEDSLADELARLGELFEHRVNLSVRTASMMWTMLSFAMVTFVVGMVVIALFAPLVSVCGMMAY